MTWGTAKAKKNGNFPSFGLLISLSLTGEAPPPKEAPAASTPPPPEPSAPAKETPSEIPTTPPPGTCVCLIIIE